MATAGIFQRVELLRRGGHSLREQAARQVALVHSISARIRLGMSRVAEAAVGIGTLK